MTIKLVAQMLDSQDSAELIIIAAIMYVVLFPIRRPVAIRPRPGDGELASGVVVHETSLATATSPVKSRHKSSAGTIAPHTGKRLGGAASAQGMPFRCFHKMFEVSLTYGRLRRRRPGGGRDSAQPAGP